jgi:hypothetical protein
MLWLNAFDGKFGFEWVIAWMKRVMRNCEVIAMLWGEGCF